MTSAMSLLATSTLAFSRESSTIIFTVLIPASAETGEPFDALFVRTNASIVSDN